MRHEDTPEINNPKIRFPVLEGDKLMKEVLNVKEKNPRENEFKEGKGKVNRCQALPKIPWILSAFL